jgi:parvulin-like peptidyl-prolyl isomerase
MMRAARAVALSVAAGFAACSESARPPAESTALGGAAAARVSSDVVMLDLVAKVAAREKITPRAALDRLVDDAVAANAARSRGLDRRLPTSWLLTAARARIAADRFLQEARRAGRPTDAEVTGLTELHWSEVDRPPAVHVYQVLACAVACGDLHGRTRTPESLAHARETAAAVRPLVVETTDAKALEETVKTVAHSSDVELRAEDISTPFTADGRSIVGSRDAQHFDPSFVSASFAIPHVGDASPVVESPFGFHVIRLLDRIPERRMSFENRRLAFTDETYATRAARQQGSALEELRSRVPVAVSSSAERLMRAVTNPETNSGTP